MTFHEYKAENGGAEPGSQISEHLSFSRDDIVWSLVNAVYLCYHLSQEISATFV